jgi:hypothetical protein
MGRFRRFIGAAAIAGFGMAGGYSAAQTLSGLGDPTGQAAAQTFVAQQGGALNTAATGADPAVVPGSNADTSAYQGLAANPAALAGAGQAAAASDPNAGMVAGAGANQASTAVSASDAWYQASLSATVPQSTALSTSGTPQQVCQSTQTQSQVTVNDGLYTCDSTEQVSDTAQTCVQTLVVSTAMSAVYACANTFNPATQAWTPSPACAALNATQTCQRQSTTCTANLPAQTYGCQTGTSVQSTQTTCQVPASPFYAAGVQYQGATASGMALVIGPTWLYSCYAMPATGTGSAETCAEFAANSGCAKTAQTSVLVARPYAASNTYPANTRITVTQYSYRCAAAVTATNPAFAFALRAGPGAAGAGAQAYFQQCQPAYDSACVFVSRSCLDSGGATVSSNGAGLVGAGCLQQSVVYACAATVQAAGCNPPPGYTQTASSCAASDANGVCTETSQTWTLPGGCATSTDQWQCTTDVPAADPAQSSATTVTAAAWDQTCPQSSQANCQSSGTSCTAGAASRIINGVAVTEPCWSQTTHFTCETAGPRTSDCNPPAGCAHSADTCLDDPPPASGCVSVEHSYSCSSTTTETTTASSCAAQLCMGSQCFQVSGSNDSGSLAKAYTALAIGHAAGQSYADPASSLQIMPGTHQACHKALTGFSNCCKDAGWGNSLGLAQCSEAEKTLMQMQQAGECHSVGDYCSNRSLFGICLQRTMSYCCYQGSLARIINEAGRPQVGKVWGDPKHPDCSGFTVAQFQTLDLSHVDFSQFYNQALGGLAAPNSASAASNIQATLQRMQGGASPSNLSPTGP